MENRDNDVIILDGFETELWNISFRKQSIESQLKENGRSLSDIDDEEYEQLKVRFEMQ